MMDYPPIALVIGASKEATYGIKVAQHLGFKVIAFDGDSKAEGLQLADEAHVVDIRDTNAIVTLLGGRIPTCVVPVPIGRWLVSAGFINDYFGLKGPGLSVCEICTDKYVFHKALHANGLRDAKCELITSGTSSLKSSFTFPVVIKPRYGSGSRAVRVFLAENELDSYLQAELPFEEDMVIESVWIGKEYGVDGIVSDGKLKVVLLREKEITSIPARQCVGYYGLPKELYQYIYDEVECYLTQVNQAIGMHDCIFHADIIINDDGIFAIELSPRPSGHNLHNLFTPMASGVDLIETYMKGVMGEAAHERSVIGQYLIHYFDFESCVIVNVPDESYLLSKYPIMSYSCNIRAGDYMEQVFDGHTLMRRGYFVLRGDSQGELDNLQDELKKEFEVKNL